MIDEILLMLEGRAFHILGAVPENARSYVFFFRNRAGLSNRSPWLREKWHPPDSVIFWLGTQVFCNVSLCG